MDSKSSGKQALQLKESDKIWLEEAERRARQLDRGEVRLVATDEVRRKAKALLK